MIDVRAEKQWLTAAEAAAESLPDFQFDERHIRRLISSDTFRSRSRKSILGRTSREFHWSELPAKARTEYLKRHGIAVAVAPEFRDRNLEAEARARIVDAAREFLSVRKGTVAKKLHTFAANYKARRAGVEPWVYETVPEIAPHRITAWERKLRAGGTKALVDSRGRPKGGWIEEDRNLRAFIVATVAARPHLSAVAIQLAIKVDLARDVPLRTLQAFLAGLKKNNRALVKALTDPDRARSHHRPAFGSRSMHITRINQVWQIDASPADVMCATSQGPRRYKITALIDVFTRRARVVVSDQPRALATQALLRRAIVEFGLPEVLKADNGKEYRNRAVERFCRDTAIAIDWSRPFTPDEKAHIERFFRTLFHAPFFECLPGYLGHNVSDRKAIENRRSFAHRFGEEAQLVAETSLSPAQLQARIDAWLTDIYEQKVHGALGLSPAAKALAHDCEAKRLGNIRALDVLLFDVEDGNGIRIVGKRGVRVGNAFYVADELGAYMGRRVHVKRDPLDPATAIIYCAGTNQFLCVARDANSLDGESRMRVALGAKREFDRMVSRARRDTKAVQRLHSPDGLADRMLRLAVDNGSRGDAEGAESSTCANSQTVTSCLTSATPRPPREISLVPEAERALFDASRPALIEHARAQAAIEQSKTEPQPVVLTDEDRAGVVAFMDSVTPSAPAPELVQCDGYTRPFIEDDVEFFHWLAAHEDILDAGDRAQFEEWRANHSFQLLVQQRAARERALAGADA